MTFQEFAQAHNLAITYAETDENPHMSTFGGTHWAVGIYDALGPDQDLFTLHYSKGPGHEGKPPTTDEVLYCLQMDASMLDQATDFDDWAHGLGYDPDSRETERIYSACKTQTDRLRKFLGDDLLNDLMMCEEED